jgi:hypothetical protein
MKVSHICLPSTVRFHYLLALLVALIIADGLVTQFVIEAGLGREGNPFLQNLASNGNLIGFKTVGALVSAFILWNIYRRHSNPAVISTLLLVAVYTGIVYWNIFSFVVAGF